MVNKFLNHSRTNGMATASLDCQRRRSTPSVSHVVLTSKQRVWIFVGFVFAL